MSYLDKKFATKFVGYWVVNTLVLSLANSFYQGPIELGNAYLGAPSAAVFSGFLLTTLLLLAKGLAKNKMFFIQGRAMMFIYYWAAGSAGTWIVARIANISGFGISRFTWAISIGFAVSLSNWLLRQVFKGLKMN